MAKAVSSPPGTTTVRAVLVNPEIDILGDAEAPTASPASLQQAVKYAEEMKKLEVRMAALAEEQKKCAERYSQIQLNLLPDIMATIGVKKFDLESGYYIEVKDVTRGSIPTLNAIDAADEMDRAALEKRRHDALKWLRDNGAESIIKNHVVVEFGKGQDADAKKIFAFVQSKGYKVKNEEEVNYMTLNSYIKEALKSGKSIPTEAFGLFVGKKAEMKVSKK